jgi:hypothetical protein
MVADVALTGPETPESTDPTRVPPRTRRGRRVAAAALLALACVFTGVCALLLVGAWRDDARIDAHEGHAVADVLSVSFSRAAVRFVTPDGTVVIPPTGVLYPTGLAAGERVRVEYDTRDTDLVRVAGRDFRLGFLPVGISVLATWAVAAPLVWLLRRTPPEPDTATG